MALKPTYRRRLHERALEQYGYVTTADADDLGIPTVELRKLAYRGGLEQVGRGVYRFEDIPHDGKEQFMEAVLLVGGDAYLVGDAVLALHDLAFANPRRIRVATTRHSRQHLPAFVEVEQRELPNDGITLYEGIPATTVGRAILDCRNEIMTDRLIQATHEAAQTGLIRKNEAGHVLHELEMAT